MIFIEQRLPFTKRGDILYQWCIISVQQANERAICDEFIRFLWILIWLVKRILNRTPMSCLIVVKVPLLEHIVSAIVLNFSLKFYRFNLFSFSILNTTNCCIGGKWGRRDKEQKLKFNFLAVWDGRLWRDWDVHYFPIICQLPSEVAIKSIQKIAVKFHRS